MADDTNISFRSPLLSSVSFSFPYGSLASEHFFQNSYLLFKDLGRQRSGVGWGRDTLVSSTFPLALKLGGIRGSEDFFATLATLPKKISH